MSVEDLEKILSRETKNRVKKTLFVRDGVSVKLWQITVSGVLYKRSVMEGLRQQALLPGSERLVLPSRCGNVEDLDRNRCTNGLRFRDIYDTLMQ